MFSFENLPPYRKSIVFVMLVFQCLSQVRGEFELKAQLKRAAMSIGCNLVEGYGRISLKEQRHFFSIARASLYESMFLMEIVHRLNYLSDDDFEEVKTLLNEISAYLWRMISSNTERLKLKKW